MMEMPHPAETGAARPHAPGKAREHFPELDRQPETAVIYDMPKTKETKGRGRPALPGRFVLVKLEERHISKARQLGGKKIAVGIRKALEAA